MLSRKANAVVGQLKRALPGTANAFLSAGCTCGVRRDGLQGTGVGAVGGNRAVHQWTRKPPLTKIVATIGPASEDAETLQQVVDAGMRVMRVNFSHATYEEAELRKTNLRKSKGKNARALGRDHNLRAILLDTQGPEIRLGNLVDDKPITLSMGQKLELTTDPAFKDIGTDEVIYVNYQGIVDAVSAGSNILLDDGLVSLAVLDVKPTRLICLVENDGKLKSRRGVNLPGAKVDLPALSEKDMRDIRYGIENDHDFVAASFVRKAQDVKDIRRFIHEEHFKIWPAEHPAPLIVSKIENKEAVDNFQEILELSDGIMVARGDLGVEIQAEKITNLQKMMCRECNKVGKPVIVATQMLESMQQNPRPTRAEVSDVTNAVYDGADAVMLSGESAQGKYPVESVFMMRRIINESETGHDQGLGCSSTTTSTSSTSTITTGASPAESDVSDHSEGVASAAVHAAHSLRAKMILCMTKEGEMPRRVAKYRPQVPVLCYTRSQKRGRQLMLHRALHVVISPPSADDLSMDERQALAVQEAQELGFCKAGDTIIIVGKEEPIGFGTESRTLRVCKVKLP